MLGLAPISSLQKSSCALIPGQRLCWYAFPGRTLLPTGPGENSQVMVTSNKATHLGRPLGVMEVTSPCNQHRVPFCSGNMPHLLSQPRSLVSAGGTFPLSPTLPHWELPPPLPPRATLAPVLSLSEHLARHPPPSRKTQTRLGHWGRPPPFSPLCHSGR